MFSTKATYKEHLKENQKVTQVTQTPRKGPSHSYSPTPTPQLNQQYMHYKHDKQYKQYINDNISKRGPPHEKGAKPELYSDSHT